MWSRPLGKSSSSAKPVSSSSGVPIVCRIDITKRDGSTSGFRFDGQEIAVFNTREQVYATAAKPGTLDEAIAYFINDLDMRFPWPNSSPHGWPSR